jgi:hypothetical protein
MRTEHFPAFVHESMRETRQHQQLSPKVSGERLVAVAEYTRVLLTAGGQ